MILVIGLLFFIYLLIRFSGSQSARKAKREKDAFWKKEYDSNFTRKADISNLDYIKVPLDRLPFTVTEDETLTSIQDNIKELAGQPILNLTGLSNTDLKLKYGVANINHLTLCDENYTLLIQSIYRWGAYLTEHNKPEAAVSVLEYGIEIKTDISKNYTQLAELYKEAHAEDKIKHLIQVAETLNSLSKDTILKHLKEL